MEKVGPKKQKIPASVVPLKKCKILYEKSYQLFGRKPSSAKIQRQKLAYSKIAKTGIFPFFKWQGYQE
ncbi:hypothetical protein OAR84_03370 [Nitrosopumilus sp.]|nr:hypothetical protein [Nitrosopumilus sp.]